MPPGRLERSLNRGILRLPVGSQELAHMAGCATSRRLTPRQSISGRSIATQGNWRGQHGRFQMGLVIK